ncbi:polyprenyl synthetase family protein [Leuconostoc holzapfelii]|uniref:Polyprenyl synthetase family protein n=1 Tax=Leuconostoc holzapfelii TaxID=434464 RepID=A0A846ZFB8_9LACO|nr:polyprenyl synthetase family protein [Leuconostoc holzapfelii]NKZ17805.1 polyprenyl synthetase family protein [Leuconostoc holzapfelii]
MTNFADFQATFGPKIDAQLAMDLRQASTDTAFADMMAYAVLNGGKRLRPLLSLAVMASYQQPMTSQALQLATAVEWVHSYSLVHDDLPAMDNDMFRRGQPSVHAKYGEANAILVGDALLTGAFSVVTTANFKTSQAAAISNETLLTIVQDLAHFSGASGMVIGQVHDMQNHGQSTQPETAWLLEAVYTPKTAALLMFAAKLGSQLALDNETNQPNKARMVQEMTQFGLAFGLAFQIQDDLDDFDQDDLEDVSALPHLIGVAAAGAMRDRYIQDARQRLTSITALSQTFDRTLLDDFLNLIGD